MCAPAVRLLGQFTVEVGGKPGPPFLTRSASHLFAYLILRRGTPQEREVIAGVLWGERSDAEARKSLRSSLWKMRATLQATGLDPDEWFVVEARRIWFREEAAVPVDVHLFQEAVGAPPSDWRPPLPPEEAERLARGIALYRGPLLPGVYEEWALGERDRLHLLYLSALERLVLHYQARREWKRALWTGLSLLHEDPLREPIHRAVMRSHAALGDRPSALRHYRHLVEILERELEVEPMPETESLHRALRRDGAAGLRRGDEVEEGFHQGTARGTH